MAKASVEIAAVSGAIRLCQSSIQEFQKTSGELKNKYASAGSTWRDSKYKELGGVVGECTTALGKPIKELNECMKQLEALKRAIEEYESIGI